jgi:endo-1,4-beta-D-glucanase Y
MNWKVSGFTGQVAPGTGNANGATDADIDVANALLMAHKQWGSAGTVHYLQAAKTLINAIYTFEVDGNKLLKPGDAFNDYANPCYYITNSTTLFGKVEVSEGWQGSDRWQAVNTACYTLMKASRNATTGLVPDWCQTPSGALINGIINDKFESYFLYDAIRIPWRMAHAYAWYGHADAKDIASKITTWAQTNYNDPATIWDGYLLNGNVFNNPTGNPNFANLGKNHNPCFSGV